MSKQTPVDLQKWHLEMWNVWALGKTEPHKSEQAKRVFVWKVHKNTEFLFFKIHPQKGHML